MHLRRAELADAEAIAKVHVQAWNETYRGIMPDTLLDRLNVAERAKSWAERIPTLRDHRQTLIVATDAGTIMGFAGCGPRRAENLASDGEIYMINIIRSGHRRHTGTRLMIAMADALQADQFQSAGLWVLEKNASARAFYERLGGKQDVTSDEDHDGVMLTDIAILWPRVATLHERATETLSGHRPE